MTAQEEVLIKETPPPTPPPPPSPPPPSPPQWRLFLIDIPEFDWKIYRNSERTDPRLWIIQTQTKKFISKMSRQRKFLEEINNISELLSEIDEEDKSENEDGIFENDNDLSDTDFELFDTDNQEENIVNTRRRQKRMRFLSSSEDECEENDQNSETSIDGTV
ncbi:zinc finger protein 526-like [Osmia bicornis bicornis]|uniref:zinc finger protein 526-like n=1 Tax=Osmia bicornis bicornis TaxID=1437191 RepID=UPI001EAEAE9F|nr:zinc finger protein 526-like [Osmia bicornis bicornis]